jgi:hypothetical protein
MRRPPITVVMNSRRHPAWYLAMALTGVVCGCAGQAPPPRSHHDATAGRIGVGAESPKSENGFSPVPPLLTADEYEHLADRSVAGRNLTVAMAQYEKALRLDPGRARVREKRGILFLERGLAEDALLEFRAMADHNPDFCCGVRRGGASVGESWPVGRCPEGVSPSPNSESARLARLCVAGHCCLCSGTVSRCSCRISNRLLHQAGASCPGQQPWANLRCIEAL